MLTLLLLALVGLVPQALAFQYKGVSLGLWLLIEPFITPSLFLEFNKTSNALIPVDEYHYTKRLGKKEAKSRLAHHWDTFITEDDFAEIKEYGLNLVRIPFGYWAFGMLDDDPYVSGQEEYIDKAIGWAHNNSLKVMLDLHGVPGSQNGFDNSGNRTIYPGFFNSTAYVNLTLDILEYVFDKYGLGGEIDAQYPGTVISIEVLNEPYVPGGLSLRKVRQFYDDTFDIASDVFGNETTLAYQEAFQSIGYWDSWKQDANILIDHHHYEIFGADAVNMTIAEHIASIKSYAGNINKESHAAIVGEWSGALTDCTPWLNGVGYGSRYEGTKPYTNDRIGDCSNINNWDEWSDTRKNNTRKFIEIQLEQYTNFTDGFIFWTWKTETAIEWSFQKLVQYELMPQPLSERIFIKNGTDISVKKSAAPALRVSMAVFFICLVSMI